MSIPSATARPFKSARSRMKGRLSNGLESKRHTDTSLDADGGLCGGAKAWDFPHTTEFAVNQNILSKLWDESLTDGIWIAPWGKALDSLTPAQAAWTPAPDRHSIRQIVNHVCIWRETTLSRFDGRPGPSRERRSGAPTRSTARPAGCGASPTIRFVIT
ncbi:MAG: DinB family protein [Phycisphaerales bacterium]|nr:MAG: DinB family protein [Phycisphaerales bacterium]